MRPGVPSPGLTRCQGGGCSADPGLWERLEARRPQGPRWLPWVSLPQCLCLSLQTLSDGAVS